MLKIRLARVGKRGHGTFRIVVTEHSRPAKSGSLVQLGSYDPHVNRFQVDADRVRAYLKNGAQLSPTVHNLLIEHKVIEGEKVRAWRPKKREKPVERPVPTPTPEAPKAEAPSTES